MKQEDYVARIQEIKDKHGWNDLKVAAALGTTSAMISRWRRGKSNMTSKTKHKILSLSLSLAGDRLYEIEQARLEHRPGRTKQMEPLVDHFLQVVLEGWSSLSLADRVEIAGIVAAKLEKQDTGSKVG